MKKFAALLTGLTLALSAVPASAAGGITQSNEAWYVCKHSGNYKVYYYAEVENTGSERETVDHVLFEIQNGSDTTIESTERFQLYPDALEAGEKGWLVITQTVKDADREDIDHYKLTLTSKEEDDKKVNHLDTKAEFVDEDEDDNENMLYLSLTNSGESTKFDLNAAAAAYQEDGSLLYVGSISARDAGLAAGNTVEFRTKIGSDLTEEWDDDGRKVASVQGIGWTVEDIDD